LPHHAGDDAEKASKAIGQSECLFLAEPDLNVSTARHQGAMLRSLKEVQADDSVVGFYQATTLGAFFNQSLLETQAIHQEKLRHGGIVIVHGPYLGTSALNDAQTLQTFLKPQEATPHLEPSG
jgi:translation initiation factor 3 subunit H